jgi:hypothetical protein
MNVKRIDAELVKKWFRPSILGIEFSQRHGNYYSLAEFLMLFEEVKTKGLIWPVIMSERSERPKSQFGPDLFGLSQLKKLSISCSSDDSWLFLLSGDLPSWDSCMTIKAPFVIIGVNANITTATNSSH